MKKSRYIIALVVAMFAVGAILFVACEKEEKEMQSLDAGLIENQIFVSRYNAEAKLEGNLVLNFDCSKLINSINEYLSEKYEGRYIVENVSSFFGKTDNGEEFPVLQIAIVDVNEEISESIYYILDPIMGPDGNLVYAVGPNSTTFSCISYGNCRKRMFGGIDPEACQPRKNKKGIWYCTKCVPHMGTDLSGNPTSYCAECSSVTISAGVLFELIGNL